MGKLSLRTPAHDVRKRDVLQLPGVPALLQAGEEEVDERPWVCGDEA